MFTAVINRPKEDHIDDKVLAVAQSHARHGIFISGIA
jgi:hypothetical protein